MMKKRIAFFCTATSNVGLQRILNSVVNTPLVMKFSSEYELIHKVSPIEGSSIKCCNSKDMMIKQVEDDIRINFDEKPIIVITSSDERGLLIETLKANNWNKFREGTSVDVLREVRSWDYGILLLDRHEGLGVNTRFAKDALVMITCSVSSIAEY